MHVTNLTRTNDTGLPSTIYMLMRDRAIPVTVALGFGPACNSVLGLAHVMNYYIDDLRCLWRRTGYGWTVDVADRHVSSAARDAGTLDYPPGYLKQYFKALEYEYRIKTAALGTLKRYSILSLTLYLEWYCVYSILYSGGAH
jgi:hypothetical protein